MGRNKTSGVGLPGREPVNPTGPSVAVLEEATRLAGLVESALERLAELKQDEAVALRELQRAQDSGSQSEIAEKRARFINLAGQVGYQTVQAAWMSKKSIDFLRQNSISTSYSAQLRVYRKLRSEISEPQGPTLPDL